MSGEIPSGAKVTYRRQYRRCGKAGCPSCRPELPGHGPYWYAAWWADGKMRSRYIGKHLPQDTPSIPSVDAHVAGSDLSAGRADAHGAPKLDGPGRPHDPPTAGGAEAQDPGGGRAGTEGQTPRDGGPRSEDAAGGHPEQAGAPPPRPGAATTVPSALLEIRTLGEFSVSRGATLIPPAVWHRRKTVAALFKQLICAEGHRLARDQVIDRLWPDAAPATAASNLRYTLHLLRRILDEPDAGWSHVQWEGEVLALLPGPERVAPERWLDAAAFERGARRALAARDAAACAAALERYRGHFLPDDLYSEWAEDRRELLRGLRLALLIHQADLCAAQGNVPQAMAALQEVLRADPCHEGAARALIRQQATAGRRTDAMATFKRLAESLRRDLDLEPEPETQALYRDLLAGKLGASAQLSRLEPLDGSVPVQPVLDVPALAEGELVGRTRELDLLAALIRRAGQARDLWRYCGAWPEPGRAACWPPPCTRPARAARWYWPGAPISRRGDCRSARCRRPCTATSPPRRPPSCARRVPISACWRGSRPNLRA